MAWLIDFLKAEDTRTTVPLTRLIADVTLTFKEKSDNEWEQFLQHLCSMLEVHGTMRRNL